MWNGEEAAGAADKVRASAKVDALCLPSTGGTPAPSTATRILRQLRPQGVSWPPATASPRSLGPPRGCQVSGVMARRLLGKKCQCLGGLRLRLGMACRCHEARCLRRRMECQRLAARSLRRGNARRCYEARSLHLEKECRCRRARCLLRVSEHARAPGPRRAPRLPPPARPVGPPCAPTPSACPIPAPLLPGHRRGTALPRARPSRVPRAPVPGLRLRWTAAG